MNTVYSLQTPNMKQLTSLSLVLALGLTVTVASVQLTGCKAMAKTAVRIWTKKQIKNFRKKCEGMVSGKVAADRTKVFCSCATDEMQKAFKNYDEANGKGVLEILRVGKSCLTDK